MWKVAKETEVPERDGLIENEICSIIPLQLLNSHACSVWEKSGGVAPFRVDELRALHDRE